MSEFGSLSSVCFVLFLQAITCYPVDPGRVTGNEVQYDNGTVAGSYSYKDSAGNPIAVKYYADKTGYGVELNSYKKIKLLDTSTTKEELQLPKPVNDYMEPIKPLLDLAAEIMNFDHKLNKAVTNPDISTKHPEALNHLEVSKISRLTTPDYEKYYQNEVKAPKQCEKDKVRVYLAKEKRKKKNAVEESSTKSTPYCG